LADVDFLWLCAATDVELNGDDVVLEEIAMPRRRREAP